MSATESDPLLLNQVATQLSSRVWLDLVPDPIPIQNFESAGNVPRDLMVNK